MLRIIPIPHFQTPYSILDYIQAFSLLFPQKIQFLSHPFSHFASTSTIHTQTRNLSLSCPKVRAHDQLHLSSLVYIGSCNEVFNLKCRFYSTRTSRNGDEGGVGRGSRGGGRGSMSGFQRGGERRGMGGGGRGSMRRGGGNVRTRDLSLVGERRKKGGVRVGETGNMGSGEFGRDMRGFEWSDDDEMEREEDEEMDEKEDDEMDEEEDDDESVVTRVSETRFDECSLSPSTMKALRVAGYEKMNLLEEATIPVIQKGKDVLVKVRDGTGKNVAYLLPSIDLVGKSPAASLAGQWPPIRVLVVFAFRELAWQAAAEANKLLKYHASLDVQVVDGNKRASTEKNKLQANPSQIVMMGTPGRLKEHIETTPGFATRLRGLKVLVLDEADHLSRTQVRKEMKIIIDAIPKQRQTLLFSATISPEVKQICDITLKEDYEYIDTVQADTEETQVRQTYLVATLDNHFPLLYTLLKNHIAANVDYKILVFCTTVMIKKLVAELLEDLKLNVREIRSRKSRLLGTEVSTVFRESKCLILLTSGVSARGVDPDVTLVVQLGLPADKQQYINRVSRAGSKDKEGEGVLLLAPFEEFFLSSINDIPITKAPVPLVDPVSKKKVEKAMSRIEVRDRGSAYQSWLEYYNSNKNAGNDKCRLVELANEFSRAMMLDHPPAIPKKDLATMGLKYVAGLRSK